MKISVFGNPNLPQDSLAFRLVPHLQKLLPHAEFIHQDPQEQIMPLNEPIWWIIDVVKNISEVKLISDLDQIKEVKRVTLHDYDLATELKLIKKIYSDIIIKIVGVPSQGEVEKIAKQVASIITN